MAILVAAAPALLNVGRSLFGGSSGPAAGTALPYGAVQGAPFAENIRNIPSNVLLETLQTRRNPLDLPGRTTYLKDDGLSVIRAELARRNVTAGNVVPAPAPRSGVVQAFERAADAAVAELSGTASVALGQDAAERQARLAASSPFQQLSGGVVVAAAIGVLLLVLALRK